MSREYIFNPLLSEEENKILELKELSQFGIEAEKQKLIRQLNANADKKMQDYLSNYPKLEIDSFPKKEAEANIYKEDNNASVPYLTSLVGGDRTKLPYLVDAILSKTTYSSQQEAYIVSLRDAIKNSNTEEELNSIKIDLG